MRRSGECVVRLTVVVVLAWLGIPGQPLFAQWDDRPSTARFERGVVAADHPLASEAGAKMLRRGGNVVDAAVATSFALSVTRPASCGIGGGGFMLIWDAKAKKAIALDYRERAPGAAKPGMFNNNPESSRVGGLAVAVPGTVAGLCFALKQYGTLDLATVLEPAIELAQGGFPIDEHDLEIHAGLERFLKANPHRYDRDYDLLEYRRAGKKSPQWRALVELASGGRDAFYKGDIARRIVSSTSRVGGILTMEDLAVTQPVVREPLQGSFGQWDIVTMPPPSSGGIAILETLGILAAYDAQHPDTPLRSLSTNSSAAVHRVTEALKHAFADRAEYLGDPDFVDVPVEKILNPDRLARLARKIDLSNTHPPEEYGRFAPPRDAGTSHFSVMDREGNAVACTETINLSYGSHIRVSMYGLILNNEMDDFAAIPGKPNAFGLIQSAQNAVAPGKKPLSSMSPTFVFVRGEPNPVAAIGASGGPRIITTTLQILLNTTVFDQQPDAAVQSPRYHHQWMPDELLLEPTLFRKTSAELSLFGHTTKSQDTLAVGQMACRRKDGLWGVSDFRKGGRPAGW